MVKMIYIPSSSRCDIDNMHLQARALSLPKTQTIRHFIATPLQLLHANTLQTLYQALMIYTYYVEYL